MAAEISFSGLFEFTSSTSINNINRFGDFFGCGLNGVWPNEWSRLNGLSIVLLIFMMMSELLITNGYTASSITTTTIMS